MKKYSLVILFAFLYSSQVIATNVFYYKSFRCNYDYGFFTDDYSGKFKTEKEAKGFELIFDSINTDNQSGRLIGNLGATDVVPLKIGENIFILEFVNQGANTTIIYDYYVSDGIFATAHSRHLDAGGSNAAMISQYFGYCKGLN